MVGFIITQKLLIINLKKSLPKVIDLFIRGIADLRGSKWRLQRSEEVLDYRERLMILRQKRLIDSGLGCERLGC